MADKIHIIIGTKAQFIKVTPIIKVLEERKISYNLINLGQHAATISKLTHIFNIHTIDIKHSCNELRDISTIATMSRWAIGLFLLILFRRRYLKETVFKKNRGPVLVHGDTLSTLMGLLMAKRAGMKIVHIESGLRSWSYFNPFPEELIRIICMKYSDYLFAPSEEAVENLNQTHVKGKVFHTEGNTGIDAVKVVLGYKRSRQAAEITGGKPYVLVSIHRFENLYLKRRFRFIMERLEDISSHFKVIFVMHGPTEKKLNRYRKGKAVSYLPLQDYPTFVRLISDAEFVVTDGGSVQEECAYMGKPCLIMRKRTERRDGLGKNAVLSAYNEEIIRNFLYDYKKYRIKNKIKDLSPSGIVVDTLECLNAES